MFVPSLSWQNDHFCIETAQKVPFSYLSLRHGLGQIAPAETSLFFLYQNFSSACPEPVLVKMLGL
jgi:hypothetical protein